MTTIEAKLRDKRAEYMRQLSAMLQAPRYSQMCFDHVMAKVNRIDKKLKPVNNG